MKINRIFEDENVTGHKTYLFHIINLQYDFVTNEITISKKINYLYGHGAEQCDKIYSDGVFACYKTHNLEYLNENEDKIIQDLINKMYSGFNDDIKKYKIEMETWKKRIENREEHKKNFNVFLRHQKLGRILNN